MSKIVVGVTDIESTGLKVEDGHRIIEIAYSAWAYDTVTGDRRKIGKTWLQRIDPKRPIDAGAQAVHGISLADLKGCPEWSAVAPTVYKLMSKTNVIVAHNAEFDIPFIGYELIRLGYKLPDLKVFCTMMHGRGATAFGKAPNLGELCYATGVDYDAETAHAADYDVEVLETAYWKGVESGLFQAPSLL